MRETLHEETSRREFLKLGVSITAGVVVPPVLPSVVSGAADHDVRRRGC